MGHMMHLLNGLFVDTTRMLASIPQHSLLHGLIMVSLLVYFSKEDLLLLKSLFSMGGVSFSHSFFPFVYNCIRQCF